MLFINVRNHLKTKIPNRFRKEEEDLESTGEASSEDEEENEVHFPPVKDPNAELSPEHWQIGKLVKYIKVRKILEM